MIAYFYVVKGDNEMKRILSTDSSGFFFKNGGISSEQMSMLQEQIKDSLNEQIRSGQLPV